MRILPLIAIALALAASLPGPGHADCPTNTIARGVCFELSDAPARNWSCGDGYDLVAGTVRSSVAGDGATGDNTEHVVADRYWITGPAMHAPIPFRVKLHTTGVAGVPDGHCSTSRVTLYLGTNSGSSAVTVEPICGALPVDETQEIALQHTPGEVFVVAVTHRLHSDPLSSAFTFGQLSFEGLPAGYTIQSCQGYAGPVVAAAPRSWGRLKHAYR